MKRGTRLAFVLFLFVGAICGVRSVQGAGELVQSREPGAAVQDTTVAGPRGKDAAGEHTDQFGESARDTSGVDSMRVEAAPEPRPAEARSAEMGAYRCLWERVGFEPEVRWLSSGALGGVEGLSLRGRGLRRGAALAGGLQSAPDLNTLTPSLVDSVEILSLMGSQERFFSDGGEVLHAFSKRKSWGEPVGLLFLGRGGFSSKFNAFTFGRRFGSFVFAVDLVGKSFGRAASYEGHSSDSSELKGMYSAPSGLEVSLQARRFRSDLRRYTSDRTKTRSSAASVGVERSQEEDFSWNARGYFAGNEFKYLVNGPEVTDDISAYGASLDVFPFGSGGGHRAALAVRREKLNRSYVPFGIPEGEIYPPPEEGTQHSTDVTGIYQSRLAASGRTELKGLLRLDHKKLFGWKPSGSIVLAGTDYAFGDFRLEAARTALAPGFLQIYSPRDEVPRPTWLMAEEMEAETGWELAGSLRWERNRWEFSMGGFGATREHVLAPSTGSLGFAVGLNPVLVAPLEDLGEGSVAGGWFSCVWSSSQLSAGGWYSAQRSRAGDSKLPFQPVHSTGLWIKGERKYFSDDLTLGVLLRGSYNSAQEAPAGLEFPAYGVGEALGYAAISDIVFFYQIKNLETRERPSPVFDLASGRYLLQPGAEVRMGLVWYLPG